MPASEKGRKMKFRMLSISLVIVLSLCSKDASVYAQRQPWEEVLHKLYPAAKAEGEVVVNLAALENVALGGKEGRAKFAKRFPGVNVKLTHVSSSKIGARIIAEARAKMLTLDFYVDDLVPAKQMVDRGLVASLSPAELTDKPENHIFKFDQNLPIAQHLVSHLAYNTKLVNKSELPKRYEDLLDPKWKGKLAIDARGPHGFTHLRLLWGEEKFWRFIKAFPEQKPIWAGRCSDATDKVVAGEAYIGCLNYTNLAALKALGAPLEFLPMDPLLVRPEVFIPMKNSPHPNATKLLIGWMISPEGITAVDKAGAGLAVPGTRYYDGLVASGVKLFQVDKLSFDQVLFLGKTRDEIAKVWGIVQ
jgi:iron(III) transport system substrate-binding protein